MKEFYVAVVFDSNDRASIYPTVHVLQDDAINFAKSAAKELGGKPVYVCRVVTSFCLGEAPIIEDNLIVRGAP